MAPVGWVFDLDGVIWRGADPIPAAVAVVAGLVRDGADVTFVTNMSANPVSSVEGRLGALGIDAAGRVVTSAMAAATLVEPGARVVACAGRGVVDEVEARGATVVPEGPADVVVVGYHREFDYGRLTVAMRAVRGGARLIGTNDDATYPSDEGLLPGNGSLLAAVATASGAVPVVAGKPHEAMCALVRSRLGANGVVVGDRADTDGAFARALGYRFALVLSGVTTEADLPVEPAPDIVGADAAAVVAALRDAHA
jgi:4-nitrophenyl phosphatase